MLKESINPVREINQKYRMYVDCKLSVFISDVSKVSEKKMGVPFPITIIHAQL